MDLNDVAITQAPEQVNRIDGPDADAIWFVLAAWHEDKEWCGVQFGFGDYDPNLFGVLEYWPVFPVEGLELPTSNWPGPSSGTAFVTTGNPWTGNYEPVYFFRLP